MTVSMHKIIPSEDSNCLICLEQFDKDSKVVGHKDPSKTDGKIYCLVHEDCLKRAFHTDFRCSQCRRKIKASSILTTDDLPEEPKSWLTKQTKSTFIMATSFGISVLMGATIIKKAGKNANDIHLLKAIAAGSAFCVLTTHQIDKEKGKRFLIFSGLGGALGGFFGGFLQAVNCNAKETMLGALTVSATVLSASKLALSITSKEIMDDLDHL